VDPQSGVAGPSQLATVDPQSGTFSGRVPVKPGASNTIEVRAKDATGNEAVKTFQVQIPAGGAGKEYTYDANGNLWQVKENGTNHPHVRVGCRDRLVAIKLPARGRPEPR